jgi:hypothetical protein
MYDIGEKIERRTPCLNKTTCQKSPAENPPGTHTLDTGGQVSDMTRVTSGYVRTKLHDTPRQCYQSGRTPKDVAHADLNPATLHQLRNRGI